MTIEEKGGGRRVERVEPVNRVERVDRVEPMERIDLRKPLHLEHAYASTVHASQGRTVDRAIVYLDSARGQLMGHEPFYVAISRARHEVHLVTDDGTRFSLTIQRTMSQVKRRRWMWSGVERVRRRGFRWSRSRGSPSCR